MAAATSAQLRFLTDAAYLMRQAAPHTSAHLMRRRIDLALTAQAQSQAPGQAATGASVPVAALPQTDVQRQLVCASCGLVLMPGSDNTTLTILSGRSSQKNRRKRKRDEKTGTAASEPDKNKKPHGPAAEPHAGITKVYKCGLCRRETRIVLPPPPPLSKQRKQTKQTKRMPAAAARAKDDDIKPAPAAAQTAIPPSGTPKPSTAARTAAVPPAPAKASSNASSKKRAKNRKAGLLALLDKSRSSDSSGLGGLNLSFDDFRRK
ncbi:hypothetical protein SPBR_06161 [Sporothrix brasiliensis 5110]|uniref:Rnase p rpr2 rpp21 snm1 subunit domain-containing protein n=1 Tax=Sporothrix brasiliensis 5110 TaxID=1398154 RepID=A0A0C2F6G5_9PEZI|nr:uncharacterized protein SPBR_06161 [Sporothrix brasiliensis 5110]KIH94539.1 hypothetical protein SPBR_06161 [Sporothrix brasiliensis 5110]